MSGFAKLLRKNSFILLVALLLSFLLYGRSMSNGFAVDDYPAIVNNDLVKEGVSAVSELMSHSFYYGYDQRKEANEYRPFVSALFAVQYELFGEQAAYYHLISLLFYGLVVWAIFLFVAQISSRHVASLSALLFLLVPVHTEVVLNIKAQDDLFMALFLFLSLYFRAKGDGRRDLIFSLLFFFLALFSKESALPLVLAFPALDWLLTKRPKTSSVWFAAPALIYLLIRNLVITGVEKVDVVNNALVFADGWAERSAMGFALLSQYFYKLIWPTSLSWDYSYNHFELHGWMHWQSILGLLLFTGIIYLIIHKRKNPGIGNWLSFFFFFSILLYLQLILLIEATFAERFLFLPSFAFVVGLVVLLQKNKKLLWTLLPLGLFWVVLVWNRVPDWKDNYTLFKADIEKVPNSIRANTGLAFALYEKAIATEETNTVLLEQSLELYRKAINIYGNDAATWYNYGMCNLAMGDYTMAELCFKDCLRLKPNHTLAFNNLGNIQYLKGEHGMAKMYYSLAVRADSKNAEAWSNLGAEYLLARQNDSAYYALETAVQLNPQNENAVFNRNVAMKRLGLTPPSSGQ